MKNIIVNVNYSDSKIRFDLDNTISTIVESVEFNYLMYKDRTFHIDKCKLCKTGDKSELSYVIKKLELILKLIGLNPNFDIHDNLKNEMKNIANDTDELKTLSNLEDIVTNCVMFEDIGLEANAESFPLYLISNGMNVLDTIELDYGGRSESEGFLVLSIGEMNGKYYPVYGSTFDDFEHTPFLKDYIFLQSVNTYDEAYNSLENTLKKTINNIREAADGHYEFYPDELGFKNNTFEWNTCNSMDVGGGEKGLNHLLNKFKDIRGNGYEVPTVDVCDDTEYDDLVLTEKQFEMITEKYPTLKLIKCDDY